MHQGRGIVYGLMWRREGRLKGGTSDLCYTSLRENRRGEALLHFVRGKRKGRSSVTLRKGRREGRREGEKLYYTTLHKGRMKGEKLSYAS